MARKILVSAGHSTVPPIDTGAVGNGYAEADLTLELRDLVVGRLRSAGISPLVDGEDGRNEPLTKAILLARQADLAVEIHFNADASPAASGTEALSKPDKRRAATLLAGAVASAAGLPLRGSNGGWKATDSGHHKSLGFCNAGGMILEIAFISSPSDMKAYQASKARVAQQIADVLSHLADAREPLAVDTAGQTRPTTSARKRLGRGAIPVSGRTVRPSRTT